MELEDTHVDISGNAHDTNSEKSSSALTGSSSGVARTSPTRISSNLSGAASSNASSNLLKNCEAVTNNTQQGKPTPFQLGISSFDLAARRDFGEKLRIAMACVSNPGYSHGNNQDNNQDNNHGNYHSKPSIDKHHEDSENSNNSNALNPARPVKTTDTSSTTTLAHQLKALVNDADSQLCHQIELLVQFDEQEGWRETGAKHCIDWMGSELSICRSLAWERLRVGRQLRSLPVLRALFRNASLGWCKIRLLTRVADADNERVLARAALDASVSDVERLCGEYRWPKNEQETDNAGGEDAQALNRFKQRALNWRKLKSGNTELRLVLPPELAQNVLKSLEHCEDILFKRQADLDDELASQQSNRQASQTACHQAGQSAGQSADQSDESIR